jgi:hypothetical protein
VEYVAWLTLASTNLMKLGLDHGPEAIHWLTHLAAM